MESRTNTFSKKKIFLLVLFITIFILFSFNSATLAKSTSQQASASTTKNYYQEAWRTPNGSLTNVLISPLTTSFQAGNVYTYNVTLQCLGLAPNITAVSALNLTMVFYNTGHIYYSKSHYFKNLTKIDQTETQFISLSIPPANKIPISGLETINGNVEYDFQYNESFTNFNDTHWNTGWNIISQVTIRGVSNSTYTEYTFIIFGVIGAIIVGSIILYNKKQKQRKIKQQQQEQQYQMSQNNQTGSNQQIFPNNNPNNQQYSNPPPHLPQHPIYQQPQQQYNQQPPMYQQPQQQNPQVIYKPEFITKKVILSQNIKACKKCASINLATMSTCYLCGSDLDQQMKKEYSNQRPSFLQGKKFYFLLALISFSFEFVIGLSITILYKSLGGNTKIPIISFYSPSFDTTSQAYIQWNNFMTPLAVIFTILIAILLNLIPYFIMKSDIKNSQDLTISQIKSFKLYYALIPVVNVIYLILFSVLFGGGPTSLNYDFMIKFLAFGVFIGFIALPFRLWIYFKKFTITNEVLAYLANTQKIPGIIEQNPTPIQPVQVQKTQQEQYMTKEQAYEEQYMNKEQALREQNRPYPQVEQEIPTFMCPNCKNQIEKTSRFCPECGIVIEKCNLCNLPVTEEHSYCPHCKKPFHMSHLLESVKINGVCPSCKEPVQDYEILNEKND